MRTSKVLIAAAFAALAVLSAGCKKHSFSQIVPGEQIRFSARSTMGRVDAQTKTVYDNNGGAYFIVDETKYEALNWTSGDDITIGYVFGGSQGVDGKFWNYIIDPATITPASSEAGRVSSTKIEPEGGNGLEWEDAAFHEFYATYPAIKKEQVQSGEFYFRANDAGNNIAAKVPYYYPHTLDVTDAGDMTANGRTYVENMKYAYMNSMFGNTAKPTADGTIYITLAPHFTAFEISACADGEEDIPLKGFTLYCESAPISGSFYMEHLLDPEEEDGSYDWFNTVKTDEAYNDISVDFSGANISLKPSDPVNFTFFVRGGWYLNRITIQFEIEKDGQSAYRSLKLQQKYTSDGPYQWMGFTSNCKHRIYGLKVPQDITTGSEWFATAVAGAYDEQPWE